MTAEQSSEGLFRPYGQTPVIAFANEKGGVAKTTSCVNVGAALAGAGRRVLLVDLDPQAHLTAALGIPRPEAEERGVHLLLHWSDLPLDSSILPSEIERLHLIPSCPQLAEWEQAPAETRGKAGRLREKLRGSLVGADTRGYDLVFLDCPPSLGPLTATALTAATHMIVPVTPRLYSLRSMAMLGQLVARLHREESAMVKLLGILVTLYDQGICLDVTLHRLLQERIEQEFGDFMFSRTIAHSVAVSEAEAGGTPVVARTPESTAAAAYTVLADEVLARLEKDAAGTLGVFADRASLVTMGKTGRGERVTVMDCGLGDMDTGATAMVELTTPEAVTPVLRRGVPHQVLSQLSVRQLLHQMLEVGCGAVTAERAEADSPAAAGIRELLAAECCEVWERRPGACRPIPLEAPVASVMGEGMEAIRLEVRATADNLSPAGGERRRSADLRPLSMLAPDDPVSCGTSAPAVGSAPLEGARLFPREETAEPIPATEEAARHGYVRKADLLRAQFQPEVEVLDFRGLFVGNRGMGILGEQRPRQPVQVDPAQIAGLLLEGNGYRRSGNHVKALMCYQELVELDPGNKDFRFLLDRTHQAITGGKADG